VTRRRAKISCTLGPAVADPATVRAVVDAGMDVARLNLSHGTHDDHARSTARVRQAARESGRAVAVLADLQGPKIRLGTFAGGSVELADDAPFTLRQDPAPGDASGVSIDEPALLAALEPGDVALIGDGLIQLEVVANDGRQVHTRVRVGGRVSDHQGIGLPGARLDTPALTAKDRADLEFVLGLPVDAVALSFVRKPEDVRLVREVMQRRGVMLPVIAKIEQPEAVERLEAIVDAFDGILVARGDLGVQMPLERVPLVQKQALKLAREHGKPSIVATQMLESMIHETRPTRAEASDVANATLDGADCLMLTAETAMGEHPVEATATMARLIVAAEEMQAWNEARGREHPASVAEGIAHSAARLARLLDARALVAYTRSGTSARQIAARRQPVPLFAFTPAESVRNQLALVWGIESFVVPGVRDTDEIMDQVNRAMLGAGRCAEGDRVVVVAGTPPGVPGNTNLIRVLELRKSGAVQTP
jgi:pyruvate kinase